MVDDYKSGMSTDKVSCKSTELKRCIVTETCRNSVHCNGEIDNSVTCQC